MKKLLMFKASWCQPCKSLEPVVDELMKDFDFPLVKLDVNEHSEVAETHNIRTVPTLVMIDGEETRVVHGAAPRDVILNFIKGEEV